ncbi:MAG: hypothetical protein PHE52_01885 [Candidatus Pacebacteria bacterium]|nr:hypothetical protein [Candidatus Paceibacterota bacterium]
MVIPTTGLIFLFGVFVFFYLSIKFYTCYKEENNEFAKLFSYSFFLIGMNYVITSVPTLFLIDNHVVWRIIAPIYTMFVAGGWSLLGYAVFSSTFQKYSKIIGGIMLLVFVFSSLPFFFYTPNYFYTDGVLNWGFDLSSKLFFLFFAPFVVTPLILMPLIAIFFLQAKRATEKKVKIRSLGLGIAMSFMLFGMITDLILLTLTNLHPVYSDLNYLIIFTILAFTLIFSWFPPKPKYITKIE